MPFLGRQCWNWVEFLDTLLMSENCLENGSQNTQNKHTENKINHFSQCKRVQFSGINTVLYNHHHHLIINIFIISTLPWSNKFVHNQETHSDLLHPFPSLNLLKYRLHFPSAGQFFKTTAKRFWIHHPTHKPAHPSLFSSLHATIPLPTPKSLFTSTTVSSPGSPQFRYTSIKFKVISGYIFKGLRVF